MCNFMPKHPSQLPLSLWVSCDTFVNLLQPHAPEEVRKLGVYGVKQLITDWCKDHPAFAGLPFSAWCKKLKDRSDPKARPRSPVFKFSLQYTPCHRELYEEVQSMRKVPPSASI